MNGFFSGALDENLLKEDTYDFHPSSDRIFSLLRENALSPSGTLNKPEL
jgi:hypothetical protein